jgi:hypothetical protein
MNYLFQFVLFWSSCHLESSFKMCDKVVGLGDCVWGFCFFEKKKNRGYNTSRSDACDVALAPVGLCRGEDSQLFSWSDAQPYSQTPCWNLLSRQPFLPGSIVTGDQQSRSSMLTAIEGDKKRMSVLQEVADSVYNLSFTTPCWQCSGKIALQQRWHIGFILNAKY